MKLTEEEIYKIIKKSVWIDEDRGMFNSVRSSSISGRRKAAERIFKKLEE